MELSFWSMVAVLVSTIVSDIIWAYYFIKVAQNKPHQAGIYSILIALNSSFITISYISNAYFLIPMIIGAYIGTYIAVKRYSKTEGADEKIIELQSTIKNLTDRMNKLEEN